MDHHFLLLFKNLFILVLHLTQAPFKMRLPFFVFDSLAFSHTLVVSICYR
jgi:hypothetical protein